MEQFKHLKLFPLLFCVAALGLYCKKSVSENTGSTGDRLQIVKNSARANSTNALQAVYESQDKGIKGYYYGSFNAAGEPDSLKSLVIQKLNSDTSVSLTFDKNIKVQSMYINYGSRRDTTLFNCDYSVPGQTLVKVFFYDPVTNKSRLKYEYRINDLNMSVISSKQYASIGGGFLNILTGLLKVSPNPPPDPWMSQLIVAQGAIKIIDLITIGVGIWGCTITLPACIAGAVVVAYLGTGAANASPVDATTINGPIAPTEPRYKTGDIVGGGVIISVDDSGVHGVIASTADQSAGVAWSSAFGQASSYKGGGYTNWRLPTYTELVTLYNYRSLVGNFSTGCDNSSFPQCTYWTSEANGGSFAWAMYFTDGNFWSNYGTTANARVRAVRSF